jgi:hypothetical protein
VLPTKGIPKTTTRLRHQEHAADQRRTPPLQQPDAGQRSTRASPRPHSMSFQGPRCAHYLRNTRKTDAKSTGAHPLRTPHLEQPNGGQRSTRAFPCPSKIPRDEMCPLLKQNPQLRRESDAKSTPPTHSVHPLLSSQMQANVAPKRFHAQLQCHPEGRDVYPT